MTSKIALRNVFRNKRRTSFTLTVIILGVAILFFAEAFIAETLVATKRSLACDSGAVQVADRRLFENTAQGYEYLITPETLEEVIALVQDRPGVIGLTWRLGFAGLIGDERGSTLLLGRGLIPCNCVQDYSCILIEGRELQEDSGREVLLGRGLADRLGVQPGERINIATGTVSGNFNAATVEIAGLLRFNNEVLDDQRAFLPLSFTQKMLRTDGVERVLIGLENLDDAKWFADSLQEEMKAQGIPLEARPWQELNSFYDSLKTFWSSFSGFTTMGVFVLVFFSVLEVLTMSFLERTREVGTIRAVGTTRGQIFRMFLLEGATLGLFGAALGVLVGVGLGLGVNILGFQWVPPGAVIPEPVRLQVGIGVALLPFFTAILSTLLGAIYPAIRVSRKRVVEALTSV